MTISISAGWPDRTRGGNDDCVPPATSDREKAGELVKRLVGQRTSSHGGTHVDRRTGLLDEIPHVRLIRGVIIVRTEDTGRVMRFLEDLGAEMYARTVILTKPDREALWA